MVISCARCQTCPARYEGICGALSDEDVSLLGRASVRRVIAAHNTIFVEGDFAHTYFTVVHGVIKLVKTLRDGNQHIVGLKYPPDIIIQNLGDRHTYSAEAVTDAEVCAFPRAIFETLEQNHIELEHRLLKFTLRELERYRDWTVLLGQTSAYERVAGFLLLLAQQAATAGATGKRAAAFRLPFTRAEMADHLGLSLETVSRQLSLLKRNGIIILPTNREVIVPHLDALAASARVEPCEPGGAPTEPRPSRPAFELTSKL